jgi:hypothetical protein
MADRLKYPIKAVPLKEQESPLYLWIDHRSWRPQKQSTGPAPSSPRKHPLTRAMKMKSKKPPEGGFTISPSSIYPSSTNTEVPYSGR